MTLDASGLHVVDPNKLWFGFVPFEQYTSMHVWMWRRLEVLDTATQKFVKLPGENNVLARIVVWSEMWQICRENMLTTKISPCQHHYKKKSWGIMGRMQPECDRSYDHRSRNNDQLTSVCWQGAVQ